MGFDKLSEFAQVEQLNSLPSSEMNEGASQNCI